MVGLSVVLDNTTAASSSCSQVVSKASMIIKSPSPTSCRKNPFSLRSSPAAAMAPAAGFLDYCFLCKQRLLPGKDIYMYKGDRGFCSVECRCRQIVMDEEEQAAAMKPPSKSKRDHCSLAAMKPQRQTPSWAPPPPPPPKARRGATGNRPNAFAY